MTVPYEMIPNRGVGAVARDAIRRGMSNEETLERVHAVLPEAKTTMQCINWYRCKMRRDGERVMTNVQLRAARDAEQRAALELDAA